MGRLKDEGTIGGQGISASAADYLDFLQIECKNYLSGVDKTVFSNVVKRVRPICLISILFASSLNEIGVCLRSSTSPAWPVPTERTVTGGKSIYNYYEYDLILYIWYCIITTKNGDSRSI